MSNATHLNSIQEATASIMGYLSPEEQSSQSSNEADVMSFNSHSLILYALGGTHEITIFFFS